VRARKSHHRRGGELVAQSRREDGGHRNGRLADGENIDVRGIGDTDIERARGQPRRIDSIDGGAIDALQVASDVRGVRQT
jgi:hypothetical protein